MSDWTNPAQRSEVLPPISAYDLAAVLVMGFFALSLAAAGVIYQIVRRGKR